ncbi:MAG: MFS transporter [Bacteroidetes bacterium]|nr:MFS transporter [Bacteroidota bacterium]
MGFLDIVGVSTGYIKNDFGLEDKVAQFLPSMALIWFFLFSVPAGLLIERYGKKILVNIGMLLTGVSMVVPFVHYSYTIMLGAFILLGIGNTIVQVAANPLLHDVVAKAKYSSYMSLSQFIKAICSLLGPVIATFMAMQFGNWKLVFAVYAAISFLTILWLYLTPISEAKLEQKPATFKSSFSLLGNRSILLLVIGIFMIVGTEVGMNSNIANYLQNRFHLSLDNASLGISIFFTAEMIGRFIGAVLLRFIKTKYFFRISTILATAGLILLLLAPGVWMARIAIFVIGLGAANIFPLIFSIAVEKLPNRVNEISGLMIMAVAGGAFIPPIMGFVSSAFGVLESFIVLLVVVLYLLVISLYSKSN